jgi:hypothetical protein
LDGPDPVFSRPHARSLHFQRGACRPGLGSALRHIKVAEGCEVAGAAYGPAAAHFDANPGRCGNSKNVRNLRREKNRRVRL